MSSKPKSRRQAPAEAAKVGLDSDFDLSACSGVIWGFVCAGIDQAAAALKDQIGAKRWVKNIAKTEAVSEGDYFVPFKVVGNSWTNVVDVLIQGKTNLSEPLLAATSKKLKTKAILAVYESTAGVFLYVHYDHGKIVEVLSWDGSENSEVVKSADAARGGFCFYSSLRSVRPGELTNRTVVKFFDSLLRSHGVFLVLESGSKRNGVVTFRPERLRSSEVERADYVGLLSDAELTVARTRNEAESEFASLVEECNESYYWVFKAKECYKQFGHARPSKAQRAKHEARFNVLLPKLKRLLNADTITNKKWLLSAARFRNPLMVELLLEHSPVRLAFNPLRVTDPRSVPGRGFQPASLSEHSSRPNRLNRYKHSCVEAA